LSTDAFGGWGDTLIPNFNLITSRLASGEEESRFWVVFKIVGVVDTCSKSHIAFRFEFSSIVSGVVVVVFNDVEPGVYL